LVVPIFAILVCLFQTGCATTSLPEKSSTPNQPTQQGQVSISPSSLAFGNVNVGSSASQKVSISNSGSAPFTVTAYSCFGTGFTVTGPAAPFTVAAGQSASFTAKFSPGASGDSTGDISIATTEPSTLATVALSGAGVVRKINASSTNLSFGIVAVGNTKSQTVTLTNTGTGSVTISQAVPSGASVGIAGLTLPETIAAGSSEQFSVTFTPAAAGSITGSISLVSDATNSPLAISISGTGTAGALLLGVSSSTLNLGTVIDGDVSSQNVIITNTGNGNVTFSGVTVSGTGFSASGVSPGLALSPGQVAVLVVAFKPSAAVTVTGSIVITSNAANSPLAISVTAAGVQSVAHSVTLSWTPSTSAAVVTYNVYRSTTSGGPYSLISSAPAPAVTFTDANVQTGVTYFYVVTAVDGAGNESVFSNQTSATVPTT
jgi:Abnormal spindle-like microcephaly-assoc'd, ASPM-SPD-2-Hydin